jgi:hypothetical protein
MPVSSTLGDLGYETIALFERTCNAREEDDNALGKWPMDALASEAERFQLRASLT